MKTVKQFIYIITIILQFQQVNAQQQSTSTYNLCYPDETSPLNNALLTNLKSTQPSSDKNFCLSFNITTSYKYRTITNGYRSEIFINSIKLNSPLKYQKFDIENTLYPITTKIAVTINNKTKSFNVLIKNGTRIGEVITSDQPKTFTVKIQQITIDQNILINVVEKQKHISEYYTTDTQIKLATEDLIQINPDSLSHLEEYLEITRKNFELIKRIKSKNLYSNLNLGQFDPLNVYKRTNDLYKNTFDAKSSLTNQNNNLAEEYLRMGQQALQNNDTLLAVTYFNKSIAIDPKLAGPRVEKVKIDFIHKEYRTVISKVRFIAKNTSHDSGDRKTISNIINQIISFIVTQAESQNKQSHYQEALTLLDSATTISKSITIIEYSDLIEIAKSHSWRGLLNQQILNWFSLIDNNQYTELPHAIKETFKFRQNNSKYLTTNELLYTNLKIIQDSLLTITKIIKNDNPEFALDALNTAKYICTTYSQIQCSPKIDELFSQIFKVTYDNLLSKADRFLTDSLPNKADSIQSKAQFYCRTQNIKLSDKHKYIIVNIAEQRYLIIIKKLRTSKIANKNTITLLDSALTISKHNNIKQAQDENFLKKQILTDYITDLIDKTDKMIKATQIHIANNLMNEINWVIDHFKFNLSNTQQKYVTTLISKLETKNCYSISKKINIELKAAEIFESKNDYKHQQICLNKALEIATKHNECNQNSTSIKNKINKTKSPANYQITYSKAYNLAINNRFQQSINAYDSLLKTSNDSLLNKFNIKTESLNAFALNTKYLPFIQYTATILAKRGFPGKSFLLLTYLYQQNYTRDLTKNAQIALGQSLAKEFYIKSPSEESKNLYTAYIIEKKWSKYFKKSFLKQWKIIQKSTQK